MNFRPTKVSTPPRRPVKLPPVPNPANNTISSTTSTLPLSSLTSENIRVIDAIIQRAPSTATTFLAVFKAYNEVLVEKGLDASEDVTYYGFLLKLGVVKGKDWGERWKSIKESLANNSRGDVSIDRLRTTPHVKPWDDGDSFLSATTTTEAIPHHKTRLRPRSPVREPMTTPPVMSVAQRLEALRIKSQDRGSLPPPSKYASPLTPSYQRTPTQRRPPLPSLQVSPSSDSELSYTSNHDNHDEEDEEEDDRDLAVSTKPPSYHTYAPDVRKSRLPPQVNIQSKIPQSPARPTSAIGQKELRPHPKLEQDQKGVNGHDYWQVVDMERDADDFRQETLLRQCWNVWRNGVEWIATTSRQVSLARDHITLRSYFSLWLAARRRHADLATRVEYVDDVRRLRSAFRTWQRSIGEKKRRELRAGVKRRLSLIQSSIDFRIKKEAWKTWVLAHRSVIATSLHETNLKRAMLTQWRVRLMDIGDMSLLVDDFKKESEQFCTGKALDVWRRRVDLKVGERIISQRVGRRVKEETWETWRRDAALHSLARNFHAAHATRHVLTTWKAKFTRLKALTKRVNTHIHRKDSLLLRAVLHVWVARERGELLERVRRTRLGLEAVKVWRERLQNIRQMDGLAAAFSVQTNQNLLARTYRVWCSERLARNNAITISQDHYQRRLLLDMFNTWRSQKMAHARKVKQARIARRWFLKRACWTKWKEQLESRGREKKLLAFESKVVGRCFNEWREIIQRRRSHNLLAEVVETRVNQRIQRDVLQHWTGRIVNLNDRLLQVQETQDARLIRAALSKWIDVHYHLGENVALMQSFQAVKREDLMRRAFVYWNQASRTSIHRRERLIQKEEEHRLATIASTWERWRDRFKEERLRGIEYEVMVQMQTNQVFRAFRLWEARTNSIPAVRLYAKRMKERTMRKWLEALPRAKLEREGREFDQRALQGKMFKKWILAYKAKITLKAVARARYLRLPTSTPARGSPSTHKSLSARPLGLRAPAPSRPRTFPSLATRNNAPLDEPMTIIITPSKRSSSPTRPLSPSKPLNPFRPRRTSLLGAGQVVSAPGSTVADEVERDKSRLQSQTNTTPFARRVLLSGGDNSPGSWSSPGIGSRERLNQELRLPSRRSFGDGRDERAR